MASVGFFGRHLGFTRSNPGVEIFRHAVALDERRVKFLPSLCRADPKPGEEQDSRSKSRKTTESTPWDTQRRQTPPSRILADSEDVASPTSSREDTPYTKQKVRVIASSQTEVVELIQMIQKAARFVEHEQESSGQSPPEDGYREVWFAGCHSGELTTPFMIHTHESLSRRWRWQDRRHLESY